MKRHFTLLLLTIVASVAFAQIPNYVPTNGLIGYWPLDGTGNDLTSGGNHLTNTGAVPTTDRNGNANAAFSFNGSSQYMVNSAPSFSFNPNDSFTVSIWYYKPALAGGVAIMFGNTLAGNFIWNLQSGTANQTQFGVNKQQSSWFWAIGSYNVGVWEHFVGVYQGGQMTLYKNGAVAGTNTYTHTGAVAAVQPLNVGKGISGNFFNGSLDDIAIYDRALSVNEIGLLYAGCGSLIFTQPANQTQNILSNANFSTNATSNSTYQWQENSGSGWADVSNGSQYSGATSGLLSISNLSLTNHGGQFRCLIANGACLDTSDVASLTVNCINIVSSDPSSQVANTNASAQMTVSAIGAGAGYQWQTQNGGTWNNIADGGQYSGATTNTLTISALTLANHNQSFRCVVGLAGCADTSAAAPLTVLSGIGLDEVESAEFNFYPNPASKSITLGFQDNLMDKTLFIQDLTGKVVMTVRIESLEQKLDISALQPGVYTISIENIPNKTLKLMVK